MTSRTTEVVKVNPRTLVRLALVSLLICGIFFPLIVTGLAQVLFLYQANGEITQLNGRKIGSELIAQNFTLPVFFQPRSDSASGVDPHITLQEAYLQITRIQESSGITRDSLTNIVNQNVEGTLWIFGSPYVNVLRVNLALMKAYPLVYSQFQ